jgi:hypothetical protein
MTSPMKLRLLHRGDQMWVFSRAQKEALGQ